MSDKGKGIVNNKKDEGIQQQQPVNKTQVNKPNEGDNIEQPAGQTQVQEELERSKFYSDIMKVVSGVVSDYEEQIKLAQQADELAVQAGGKPSVVQLVLGKFMDSLKKELYGAFGVQLEVEHQKSSALTDDKDMLSSVKEIRKTLAGYEVEFVDGEIFTERYATAVCRLLGIDPKGSSAVAVLRRKLGKKFVE